MIGLDELISPTYGCFDTNLRIPGLDFPVDSDGKRSTTGLNQGPEIEIPFFVEVFG